MEVKTVATPTSLDSDYHALNALLGTLDAQGNIPFETDKKAARAFFLHHVNQNTVFFHSIGEQLDYLLEHGYYDSDVFSQYSDEFLKTIYDQAFSYKFRFRTFIGAFKFYSAYALKTRDGARYLERYEHRVVACALMLARGDEDAALDYVDEIITGRAQPATPTFANAGKKNFGELVSCFLTVCDDNLEDITQQWRNAAQLSKIGGGVGICLTDLREDGAPIKGVADRSSGVLKVAKVLEDIFSYVDQLGTRPGAGIVWIDALHMDAPALIEAKKENADEKIRLKMLNIGICTPDIMYEMAFLDKDVCLFSSYDIFKVYGIPMSQINMDAMYHELEANPKIGRKKVNARDYFQTISCIQMESGYPFIAFIDTINRANNIKGRVRQSNLCTEILQVSEHSVFNPDGTYASVGKDISCNLLSLNVLKAVHGRNFGRTVARAVRMCTSVSIQSNVKWVPSIARGNRMSHSIGVGAMNLHGTFAYYGMRYGSDDSIWFTDLWFMALRYHALRASCDLARETGEKFDGFEDSAYADGSALRYYRRTDYLAITPKHIQELFLNEEMVIPDVAMWEQLIEDIIQWGLFNQYLLAVAPTGSISYINDATASIHPVSARLEKRQEGKVWGYYPAPHMTNENQDLYEDAFDIGWKAIIDVYAAAQKHVDQGMSLTLFFQEEDTTTRDIDRARAYAWRKGIKTLYYIRARQRSLKDLEKAPKECESCVV